jgi:hypothetical protein
MVQENSPSVNLMNKYNEGGMNNQTLGAAQMQAGLGEIMLGWPMKNVGAFLNRVGDINIKLMIQFFGDEIMIRPSANEMPQTYKKKDFMGEFAYENKSTIFINEMRDRIDKANVINQIINWKASIVGQDFQTVRLQPFIDDFIRAWVGQGADLKEYIQQGIKPPPPGMPPQGPGVPPAINTPPPSPQTTLPLGSQP